MRTVEVPAPGFAGFGGHVKRRSEAGLNNWPVSKLRFGGAAAPLDAERMQAQWDGKVVLLSLTEFWMVHALARHPGHVRNRQQLMDAANVVLDDNTITSHVKRIRRKFQTVDPDFDAVQTVYGMGYRWVE